MAQQTTTQLTIDGGPKAFDRPFPPRRLFGREEKQAAITVFEKAIETGEAVGLGKLISCRALSPPAGCAPPTSIKWTSASVAWTSTKT